MSTEEVIQRILRNKPRLTREAVKRLVDEERAKAAGLLTEEAAAYLVASNLGIGQSNNPSGLPPGMREASPQRQSQQPIPEFHVGQRLEADIVSMVPSTYDSSTEGPREQIQFDVNLKPSGYQARGWISYYKVPNPKQKIGKLYMAIQRVTGQVYQNVDDAMEALKGYGKIFFEFTGYRTGPTPYPKFAIVADMLPTEGAQQPSQQSPFKRVLPTRPTLPSAPSSPHEKMIAWVKTHPELVGNFIPLDTYNKELAHDKDIVDELVKEGLAYNKSPGGNQEPEPFLDEKARKFL